MKSKINNFIKQVKEKQKLKNQIPEPKTPNAEDTAQTTQTEPE